MSLYSWLSSVRVTRRVQLVEQELLTLPEHLNSSPFFCVFFSQLESLMKSLYLLVKEHKVPVPYPGLVNISSM